MSREGLNTRLIQIDLDFLEEQKMLMNHYLALMKLYSWHYQQLILPIEVHEADLNWLLENGFVTMENVEVVFTEKGLNIFERKQQNLFTTFFELYPHKVPDGTGGFRILGTKDPDTIFGKRMLKKWNIVTKGNTKLQEAIIEGLKNELSYRKKSGSLAYMQNMDTWLNQGTWEKYQSGEKPQSNTEKLI